MSFCTSSGENSCFSHFYMEGHLASWGALTLFFYVEFGIWTIKHLFQSPGLCSLFSSGFVFWSRSVQRVQGYFWFILDFVEIPKLNLFQIRINNRVEPLTQLIICNSLYAA